MEASAVKFKNTQTSSSAPSSIGSFIPEFAAHANFQIQLHIVCCYKPDNCIGSALTYFADVQNYVITGPQQQNKNISSKIQLYDA
jgi:hypothetical protein